MVAVRKCNDIYEEKLAYFFEIYGYFVTKHPVIVLTICLFVNSLLGIGLLNLHIVTDIEEPYTPTDSDAVRDRNKMKNIFPDASEDNFYSKSVTDFPLYAELIVKTKNGSNILSAAYIEAIQNVHKDIMKKVKVKNDSGHFVFYSHVCALRHDSCVIQGDVIFSTAFLNKLRTNNISYPLDFGILLKFIFGEKTVSKNKLTSASMVRLVYFLRSKTSYTRSLSIEWEKQFLETMQSQHSEVFDFAFSTSSSLNDELSDNSTKDMILFSLT